jgi:(2Fe-2S) ferredoxin
VSKIRYRTQLFICSGKACSKESNPDEAKRFFKERIKDLGLKAEVRSCTCSCLDYCDDAPNMVVYPEGTILSKVKEKDWEDILKEYIVGK